MTDLRQNFKRMYVRDENNDIVKNIDNSYFEIYPSSFSLNIRLRNNSFRYSIKEKLSSCTITFTGKRTK